MGGGLDSVDVCGGTIGFERCGHGPPLVLVHGAVSDSRDWRLRLEALSDEFTVVPWDAPVSVGEELHAQIPGSTFVVIPGPGHMVNLEAPDRFNDEVRSFLMLSAS